MGRVRLTRRAFLRDASAAAVAAGVRLTAVRLPGFVTRYLDPVSGDPDPELKALTAAALDAARTAGASYADVRLTLEETRYISVEGADHVGTLVTTVDSAIGVRVLVDGYWGFVSAVVWSTDEAVRVARAAVAQARAVNWGTRTPIELAAAPAVTGQWSTPIERDALVVSPQEIIAHLVEAHAVGIERAGSALGAVKTNLNSTRTDRTFASSEGTFVQQRIHKSMDSGSGASVRVRSADGKSSGIARALHIWPSSGGYELLPQAKLKEQMPALVALALRGLGAKPSDTGRFDVVLDARSTAQLLARTIGRATQLDRALGSEANSTGTSFIAPPDAVLGHLAVGAPAVTVTGDRTTPHGAATVGWDDEGVAPPASPFSLIERGVVTDYQTSREEAATLRGYYGATNRPVGSRACGTADSAHRVPLAQCPNLAIEPGTGGSFEDLVRGVANGYAFLNALPDVDQQALTGQSVYQDGVFRIRKGALAEPADKMVFLFRTPEMWKSVQALGGPASALTVGDWDYKGQPYQRSTFSITAVPARFAHVGVGTFVRLI